MHMLHSICGSQCPHPMTVDANMLVLCGSITLIQWSRTWLAAVASHTWHVPITDSIGMGSSAPSSSSSPELAASLDTLPTCVLNTTCTASQAHTAQQTHFDFPFPLVVVQLDACCLYTHTIFTSISLS